MRVFESCPSLVLASGGCADSWLCRRRGSYLVSLCPGFRICVRGFTAPASSVAVEIKRQTHREHLPECLLRK